MRDRRVLADHREQRSPTCSTRAPASSRRRSTPRHSARGCAASGGSAPPGRRPACPRSARSRRPARRWRRPRCRPRSCPRSPSPGSPRPSRTGCGCGDCGRPVPAGRLVPPARQARRSTVASRAYTRLQSDHSASSDPGPVLQRSPPGGTAYASIHARPSYDEPGQLALAVVAQIAGDDAARGPHQRLRGQVDRGTARGRALQNCSARASKAPDRAPRTSRICGPPETMSTNSSRPAPGCAAARAANSRSERRAPAVPSPRPRGSAGAHHQQPFGGRPVGGEQARFLVLELLVEGRTRDARLGADLGDGGGVRTPWLAATANIAFHQSLALRAAAPRRRRSRARSGRRRHDSPRARPDARAPARPFRAPGTSLSGRARIRLQRASFRRVGCT